MKRYVNTVFCISSESFRLLTFFANRNSIFRLRWWFMRIIFFTVYQFPLHSFGTPFLKFQKITRTWRVLRINKHNGEQDRMLLLTQKAMYRVTYQYQQNKIIKSYFPHSYVKENRFTRFPVADVTSIQVGLLKIDDEASFHFGIRIYFARRGEEGLELLLACIKSF